MSDLNGGEARATCRRRVRGIQKMAMKAALRITACLGGLALFTAGLALGQHTVPKDYKGVEESVLAAIDLAKELDSVENRELRVSRAIVAPQSPRRSDDRLRPRRGSHQPP